VKYRRAAPLVIYWQDEELVFENYALRTRISADALVCSILNFCGQWRTVRSVHSHLGAYDEASVRKTLEQLFEHGVLERSNATADPRVSAMNRWAAWNPAAGLFHFSTKDTDFALDQYLAFRHVKRQTKYSPIPVPVKSYLKAPRTKLPRTDFQSEFSNVLKSRRTWRKFGRGSVSLQSVAQMLDLTFGIREWVNIPGLGKVAAKTSPSGGSLHPVEAYVLAQRVEGLKPGIYHYNSAAHELEWLREGVARPALERALAGQWWFTRASFLIVMTAVFGRTQWKYEFPRTYRVVLAEAGHLCQTLCLTATWLGLAPFCTMALTDTKWEEWLGVDGVNESILYVAGAGPLPDKADMKSANILTSGKRTASISKPS
jgi:SagB-type dehydrogenase family enzyme